MARKPSSAPRDCCQDTALEDELRAGYEANAAMKDVRHVDAGMAHCLNDLDSRISDENRHGETDWGSSQGEEVW